MRRCKMTLVKWNPRRSLFNLNDDLFTDFFNDRGWLRPARESWYPVVDVSEDDNAYHMQMELPGLSKDDVKISFHDDILTISGEKKHEKKDDNRNYHYFERNYGKFERSFRINSDIVVDKIDATFNDGILNIEMPKAEVAKPKEIAVKIK